MFAEAISDSTSAGREPSKALSNIQAKERTMKVLLPQFDHRCKVWFEEFTPSKVFVLDFLDNMSQGGLGLVLDG